MPIKAARDTRRDRIAPGLLPLGVGVVIYALLLIAGNKLLVDPDTFWQILVGQWIADHRSVPVTDIYSFTKAGELWVSTQWLAQFIFGQADRAGGWTAIVIVTSIPIALTFAILAQFLDRRIGAIAALVLVSLAFVIALPHLLARPHAMSLPVMVAWTAGLLSAAERRAAPSWWFAALIVLWANLHGSFVFGLMLVAPIALDALWNAKASARKQLALRWAGFGVLALVASCITPYGWGSLLAANRILSLGEAMSLIREWTPANFATFGALEACVLAGLGLALFLKISFPPMRIVLLLGLLHMAFAHVRNADVFALLAPMVLAAPLAARFRYLRDSQQVVAPWAPRTIATFAGIAVMLTATIPSFTTYAPSEWIAPSAAVSALKAQGAKRVFNDYDFGGYLIWRGVPTYIDGRAELYGEQFIVEHNKASSLQLPLKFFELLDTYKIDATLLRRQTAGAQLLDKMPGWQQIYSDDVASVHIRKSDTSAQK